MRLSPAFILLLFSTVAHAQTFAFGIKGGARLTDDLDSYSATSESKRYVVGPMATVGFRWGFSVEVDALYRRVGYRSDTDDIIGDRIAIRTHGNSMEFPIVLRKAIAGGFYAGVGYAPRIINGTTRTNVVSVINFNPLTTQYSEFSRPADWNSTHGVVTAVGIERRAGPIRIAPEARYIFWTSPALTEYGSRGYFVQFGQHQLDLLIGVTWGGR